ncbi:cytochrome P450 [Ammoniphilus sp. 3BR4]|uniref:cytochrome P450 n=1 Tax=Ammoniphilus sp. 3BR4 TaxID=3158265 RepID=UPI0034674529
MGRALGFGDALDFAKDPLAFLMNQKKVGDIVKVRFRPFQNFYVLYHPDDICDVLVTKQDCFHKARGLQKLKVAVGEGLLTSEGEKHRRQRKMIQPHFSALQIGRYAAQMVEETAELTRQWTSGEERWIDRDMMALTLGIITKTMFGAEVSKDTERIRQDLDIVQRRVVERTRAIFDFLEIMQTKKNKELNQAIESLHQIINGILEQRRKKGESEKDDLLSALLSARDDEGNVLTEEELRDQVMTIFLAGHETTAHTLSWTWYLLPQHPEVEHKLSDELNEVLGGNVPTYDNVRQLRYLTQIVQESMRLYPAAWAIPRKAVKRVQIGKQRFEPGDIVLISQYVVHRDSRYFEHPDLFIPERFSQDLLKKIPPYAYFPFGGGPRVCVGNHFAIMEAVLILATIAQRYKLRLTADHPPIVPEPLITMRPKNGLKMQVIRNE